jgi:hypothetical protein
MEGRVLMSVRIAEEDKAIIEVAARRSGRTVTAFLIGAAVAEAKRLAKRPERGIHGQIPNWFREICASASKGGAVGYDDVGIRLARELREGKPAGISSNEWATRLDDLNQACHAASRGKAFADLVTGRNPENADRIWMWFSRYFPRYMEMIPARRGVSFVVGVIEEHAVSDFNAAGLDA